jgi:hypothetical protein
MTHEMTKPGMAGEATLDEILASIRKVLDKEGPGGKGGDEHVFAALAPATAPMFNCSVYVPLNTLKTTGPLTPLVVRAFTAAVKVA